MLLDDVSMPLPVWCCINSSSDAIRRRPRVTVGQDVFLVQPPVAGHKKQLELTDLRG
jgi:hypothetical protein